jgi:hypothetical protein
MDDYQKPRRRRRGLLALLMAGTAIMAATGATFSLALFTSTVAVGGNGFTTGTIVLSVNPATAILTAGAMMPGDAVPAGGGLANPIGGPGQVVTVSNTGTAQLRYAISGVSTDSDGKHLNTALVIIVRQPDGNAGNLCTAFTGNILFNAVVPTAGVNMVGDPTQGIQPGDRTLNHGASETLCFKASLPQATLNGFQGATSTYTFTFAAEQTQSNP